MLLGAPCLPRGLRKLKGEFFLLRIPASVIEAVIQAVVPSLAVAWIPFMLGAPHSDIDDILHPCKLVSLIAVAWLDKPGVAYYNIAMDPLHARIGYVGAQQRNLMTAVRTRRRLPATVGVVIDGLEN